MRIVGYRENSFLLLFSGKKIFPEGLGFVAFFLSLVLVSAAACAQPDVDVSQLENESFALVCENGYLPFSTAGTTGSVTGMYAQMWNLWSEQSGYDVTMECTDFRSSLDAVRSGAADIHMGLAVDDELAEREGLLLSEPFYRFYSALYIVRSRAASLDRQDIIGNNARIGIISGTYFEDLVKLRIPPHVQVVEFDDFDALLSAALNNEIEGVFHEMRSFEFETHARGLDNEFILLVRTWHGQPVVAAVRSDREDLIAIINEGFSGIGTDVMAQIEGRWIQDSDYRSVRIEPGQFSLTQSESEFFREHGPVRIGLFNYGQPPYQMRINYSSRFEGLTIDYIDTIMGRIGYPYEIVTALSTTELVNMLEEGELDIVPGAHNFMTNTTSLRRCTQPYMTTTDVMVRRRGDPEFEDLSMLNELTIGYRRYGRNMSMLLQQYPYGTNDPTDKIEAGLDKLRAGNTDLFIGDFYEVNYALANPENFDLVTFIPPQLHDTDWCFSVRDDLPVLVDVVDRAVMSITAAEHESIRGPWLERPAVIGLDRRKVVFWVTVSCLSVFCVLFGILIWNRKLGQEVQRRKSAEKEAQESQVFIESIFGNLSAFIFSKDKDGRFVLVNKSLISSIGLPESEILGKGEELLWGLKSDAYWHSLDEDKKVFQKGEATRSEIPFMMDGKMRTFLIHKFPLRTPEGKIEGLCGAIMDISEQKEAEIKARQAKERLQRILDESPVAMAILEGDGDDVLFTNHKFLEILGNDVAMENAKKAPDFFVKSVMQNEKELQIIREGVQKKGKLNDFELWMKTRDGSNLYVLVTAMPFEYMDKAAIMTWFYDITERKIMEQQIIEEVMRAETERARAEEAAKAKSHFLATMSHEIRTPLNGINGLLELLWLSELDHEQKNMLDAILGSAETLLTIIDDILDFSKIEAGELAIEKVSFSLPSLIQGVQRTLSANAAAKSLTINLEIDPQAEDLVVRGDPVRLRQVFFNVLNNAIKFTEKGHIDMRVHDAGKAGNLHKLHFEIEDTGIGIPEERIERLYEPFTQAESSTTRRFGGSGLGLAITRNLVNMMKGEIAIQSKLGEGTLVSIDIPMEVVTDEDEKQHAVTEFSSGGSRINRNLVKAAPPSVEEARASGRLILLVEDHDVNRYAIKKQLNRIGYAVEIAENGKIALDKWRQNPYGLIMTDCHMPEMDGYDLTRHIRKEEIKEGREPVPVIAITANAMSEEAEKCFEAGMNDYISKPVALSVMADKIAMWLVNDVAEDEGAPTDAQRVAAALMAQQGADQPVTNMLQEAFPASPLDLGVISEMMGDHPDQAKEMLFAFLETSEEDMRDFDAAEKAKDAGQLGEIAHRLKSASLTIGASDLGNMAKVLEDLGKQDDWPGLKKAIPAFRKEMAHICDYIGSLEGTAGRDDDGSGSGDE